MSESEKPPAPRRSSPRLPSAGDASDDLELEAGFAAGEEMPPSGPRLKGTNRHDAPWPTGTTPEPQALRIDATDVERLAAYGDPGGPLLLAPLYAYRVFSRRRELARLHARARAQLSECEARRDAFIRAAGGAIDVDDETPRRLRAHDEEVARSAAQHELHGRALSAYHHGRVRQGLFVGGAALLCVAALLLYAAR